MGALEAQSKEVDAVESGVRELRSKYAKHEESGTLGRVRAALAKEAKVLEERVTTRCCAIDGVECAGDDEARARRKALIRRLDSLSAEVRGLGLLGDGS